MQKEYLTLNKISSYKMAFALSNYTWKIISKWDWFEKNTVGSRFVRALDSISANIAEGFGRYNKKDKISFYRIARASTYESLDWLEKSKRRNMISEKDYEYIFKTLKTLPKEINTFIKFTNNNLTV